VSLYGGVLDSKSAFLKEVFNAPAPTSTINFTKNPSGSLTHGKYSFFINEICRVKQGGLDVFFFQIWIISLIKDCLRDPFVGWGKPEPLKRDLAGLWSRRIDNMHRLVYKYEKGELFIFSCRFHY